MPTIISSTPANPDFRLIHGECLAEMAKLPAGSVDMILADIPYGAVNRKSSGLRNLDKGKADICGIDLHAMVVHIDSLTRGSAYVFCGTEQVSIIRAAMVSAGMSTRLGIWEKTNPSPMNGDRMWLSSVECCVFGRKAGAIFTEHCASAVWRHPCARGKLHPTMKPVGLMERLIKASSREGDTVLDFCMGSGTTGVACKNTGRRFIGIEMDKTYFDIAVNRIKP